MNRAVIFLATGAAALTTAVVCGGWLLDDLSPHLVGLLGIGGFVAVLYGLYLREQYSTRKRPAPSPGEGG